MGEERSTFASRLEGWRGDRRIVAAVCACVALAAGVAWWRAGASAAPAGAPPIAPAISEATTIGSTRPAKVVVDVVGAVQHPGLVRVPAGARVADVIDAAGGAQPNADLVRLNLAAPIADGARVAVPAIGAPAPAVDPSAVTGASSGGDAGGSGPVNLNSATADELDALPGIGPATAAAIVSDREAHGPFKSVDDLARVRGIGPAKLAQLRDLVTT